MEQLYCMNCLRQTPAYPCPLCGFDPGAVPAVPHALAQCILHGRYLTGRPLEKDAIEILYKGMDLAENRPVVIREFFPASQAERAPDGSLIWMTQPPENRQALLARTHRCLPQEDLLDSFPENGTVYTICQPNPPSPPEAQPQRKKENEWIPFLLALLILALAALAGITLVWLLPEAII